MSTEFCQHVDVLLQTIGPVFDKLDDPTWVPTSPERLARQRLNEAGISKPRKKKGKPAAKKGKKGATQVHR
jgi:hypothetical protein